MTFPPIADINLPFDSSEANELWLRETLDKTIFNMLSNPERPAKPIDPNAPLPHWAKRTLQKAWIKQERERRAAKDLR